MIGLDTNVLARYYVEDKADVEAQKQRIAARRLIESGKPWMAWGWPSRTWQPNISVASSLTP